MAEEPDCGCGKAPRTDTTRREFLRGAAVAGASLAVGAALLTGGEQTARADGSTCEQKCDRAHARCRGKVSRSSMNSYERAVIGYPACFAVYSTCLLGCKEQALADLAGACADWLLTHPLEALGVLVLIGGLLFIVVIGAGGAVALVAA